VRDLVTSTERMPLWVDRERALYGSWYEFFPRSEGVTTDPETGAQRSGTFQSAAERLPAIASMGFDVVYLPPIHPIGEVNRKGPNNTLTPGPDDPGSPWAIGSPDGGHDAIHRDLGTIEDFDAFVARTRELGMEVAIDLALQCAPGPSRGSRSTRSGSPCWPTARSPTPRIPPKKYQDIYPINFDSLTPRASTPRCCAIVRHWMAHGVGSSASTTRTRSRSSFWEWLLAEVRKTDPDVLFLAEAFTRPPMMHTLAEGRLPPELHLLHLAQREVGARGVPPRALRPAAAYMRPELLRQHARHPARVPAVRRAGRRSNPSRAGGHADPDVACYSGLRAVRHVAYARQRGVPRIRKYQLRPRDGAGRSARAVPRSRT
jgi:hypothetical protein